jgi:hypothetical protein
VHSDGDLRHRHNRHRSIDFRHDDDQPQHLNDEQHYAAGQFVHYSGGRNHGLDDHVAKHDDWDYDNQSQRNSSRWHYVKPSSLSHYAFPTTAMSANLELERSYHGR